MFWPTLFGVNLWLVGLVVPLLFARSSVTASWLLAPLGLLGLGFGLRARQTALGQALLLLAVPLLLMLPTADGALADPQLQPRLAVLLQVALLLGYLLSTSRLLSQTAGLRPANRQSQVLAGWAQRPLSGASSGGGRLGRRIAAHRLLGLYTVTVPALLIYALDLHPPHLRALRQTLGSLRRVAAFQATVTAALTLVLCVIFYFCIAAPLRSYLDHHRELRGELQTIRRQSRSGRPRLGIYVSMAGALLGMLTLIVWSLR